MSTRRAENARRTRGEIITEATRLFGSRGFDAVSIDDICQAVGLSRGGFYHHFDNREACFEAVWQGLQDDWAARRLELADQWADLDLWEVTERSFRELFTFWADPIRRQINLYDPIRALGWERCQILKDDNGIAQVAEMLFWLGRAHDPTTARFIYAAITEATFHVGRLGCPDDERDHTAAALIALLRGLPAPPVDN